MEANPAGKQNAERGYSRRKTLKTSAQAVPTSSEPDLPQFQHIWPKWIFSK